MNEIRKTFDKYDVDGDGYISYCEAHQVLHEELGFSEDKTLKLIRIYDRNGDGRLSADEFIWFFHRIQEKKQELLKMFKKFDKDGNDSITFDEARAVLKDFKFSDEEVRMLMELHDANKDGKLQYNEFVHFWNAVGGKHPVKSDKT